MAEATLPESHSESNEDYTDAVCLLHRLTKKYPTFEEILVDAEDYPRLVAFEWRLLEVGSTRAKRAARTTDDAYLHRIVMDAPRGMLVDHRFHNTLDNRRSRMRLCTVGENNLNSPGRKKRTSRFRGVFWDTKQGKWKVHPGRRDGRVFLGHFTDEVAAARAYNEFAKECYGSFAYLNPVEPTC
jgi:hypothetical protein